MKDLGCRVKDFFPRMRGPSRAPDVKGNKEEVAADWAERSWPARRPSKEGTQYDIFTNTIISPWLSYMCATFARLRHLHGRWVWREVGMQRQQTGPRGSGPAGVLVIIRPIWSKIYRN